MEEEDRIRDDMKSAIGYYCKRHADLVDMASSACTVSLKALTYRKIYSLEKTMTDLWQVVSKYVVNIPDVPRMVFFLIILQCLTMSQTQKRRLI